ncbi:class I SAM-dependent methyltransferase [Leeuwenhoekiella marinoflava]|uniref:class I SAM-dependent methyltransferase n=1 Tax=Leeuwenhoekiella marinoflava TaxID=988 RepID=UPI003002A374
MGLYEYFETNKQTWNQKVQPHLTSDFYNVEAFKKGESSLNAYELNALPDVEGKSVLHLQCHFGQDTLSWSRRGALCTGIDSSDVAIETAKKLNTELNLNAQFICGNVLDTAELVTQTYDIVFTSYGVLGWLPDLKPWAKMIKTCLKPGGIFYIVEFHPIVWMWDYQKNPPELRYGYMQDELIYEENTGTYADKDAAITTKEYTWNHGLGAVVSALAEAGLRIEYLKENDASPYNILPNLQKTETGYELQNKLYPLIFELKATAP